MADTTPTPRNARNRHAILSRWHGEDAEVTVDAKRDLKEANLAAHIQREVNSWPPLSQEQRDRLRELLRGAAG